MTGQTRLTIVAAVATALTALVFALVFEYGGWLTPMLGAILVTAATGAAARRWRLPRVSVPFWQVLALFAWLVLGFARSEAFWWIFPTPSAISRLADVLAAGVRDVNRYAAPVAPLPGIVALAAGGVGLCHIAVDTLAVTLRRPALAGLPLLALYCVPSVLAPDGVGWGWFVLGAGGWLALLVADSRLRFSAWGRPLGYGQHDRATARAYRGEIETTPLSALGRRIGATALGAAVIVPLVVPGLDESVFGRGGAGNGEGAGPASVTVQNPMVDLQRDLNRPENRTVIRYTTDDPQPDYLRLVTLDSFDGVAWERATFDTPRDNRIRGQQLPPPAGLSDDVARERRTTQLRVLDQADSWLPMPYPPEQVRIDGGDWRFDNESLNVVAQDGSTTRNAEYEVVSLDLQPSSEQLRAAPAAGSDYDRYLELPQGLPEQVRAEAQEVVADAATPYDRALALQDWFRDTSIWTYSTGVRDGNGNAALSAFLADRTGYCEQFAATMAIMARSIGIPARVDVGFTAGRRDGDEWTVSLHDKHAWPELYFPGVGWVRFEPTPLSDGRGIDPSYAAPAAVRAGASNPTAQPAPGAAATPGADGSLSDQEARLEGEGAVGGATSSGPPRWPFVLALVLAAVAVTPRLTRSLVRRSRLAPRSDPRARAEAAWTEVRDSVRDLGFDWSSSETPRQTAHRLSDEAALEQPGREAFGTLARVVERARYARDPGTIDDLSVEIDVVRTGLAAPLSRLRRWRARWLPASAADVLQTAADRGTDGLDWLDAAATRLRVRLTPRRWRRAAG